ncbi:MAG TPA: His/Gly/Thr/Pro-type tRNA ligase C-terminal domain-containing protein [Candidatus Paceibacterota bacterium]|nr:His/Gly/Thr/Pro-type tRNA ligase C-terminal domain-containing protein [Candidatus Paceibacterota bacterium]HQB57061.1 His/Gly/Thr/Pro-type tRNA ligase C-terminal domain-containing protein [Candidatus Paceibacterota bacterium]
MLQSKLFTKTKKEFPADETSNNARFLIQAGYIFKEMAGVYSLLPLGVRVIQKIENIIREEMNKIGGLEMKTSILQNKEVWEKTGRWDDNAVDNWFKSTLKNGSEVGLSFTNEEAYANIMKSYISSYKDLPVYPYDFKSIFRNEARSKSGVMRGREFYWKALYSFSKNKEEHDRFYEKAEEAYRNVFEKVGLGEKTYLTFASGGTFSKFSHEFQTLSEAGEDTVYVDFEKKIAVNKEVLTDEILEDLELDKEKLVEKKAIEVGNIFTLGYKFSDPIDLKYKNKEGEEERVFMGSYGIGITRLMGTIVECFSDEKGIVWPESVSPFKVHILSLFRSEEDEAFHVAKNLYEKLSARGVEVLFDDRENKTPGEKFSDADLIGLPWRVVVSEKSLAAGGIEIKKRNENESKIISIEEFLDNYSY